jgi:hypothetical protein
MSRHHERNHHHRTKTTNQKIKQRSNPRTPDHEINSPPRTMKFQPTTQNQDQKLEAHLCITILRGVRASARRQVFTPLGDLPTRFVDLSGGGERC